MADTLLEDLRAGPFEMGAPIRFRFELVSEKAVSFAGGVVRVFGGERAGPVDEVRRIYYGRWRYSFDDGAEFEKEVGFLGELVGGHATAVVGLLLAMGRGMGRTGLDRVHVG